MRCKRWFASLLILAGCSVPAAPKREHEPPIGWVTRQIAAGYFPAPGVCEAYLRHTKGPEREALLRCTYGDFDGAVYWAGIAMKESESWTPPDSLR